MRLFDLVEKEDAVWVLAYRVGQDASVVIAYIAGRGADEFCDRVLFRILAHVETVQRHMHLLG